MNRIFPAGILAAFLLAMPLPARAQTQENTGGQTVQREAAKTDNGEAAWENRWFWFVCSSNYHAKLKTSEQQIDRQINGLFGLIFPGWERVTTFQDWRDDWLVWDLSVGIGRDISPHLAWTVYAGGGLGTIRNRDDYRLGLVPVGMKVYFTRTSFFTGASLRWWPWERAHREEKGFWGMVKGIRPVTEMNVGYSLETSEADVRASFPLVGDLLHINQKDTYNLFWLSPRAGIEIPFSDKYSLNLLGGYLWFNDAQDDFNGPMMEVMFCGRF
jgi:hypothetical protein